MKEISILLIGPLPPPVGGQSVLIKSIIECAPDFGIKYSCLDNSHQLTGFSRFKFSFKLLRKLLVLLAADKSIRIVHIHTSAGWPMFEKLLYGLLSKAFRKKVIFQIHGGVFRKFWDQSNSLLRVIICNLFKIPDLFLILSESWLGFYKEHFGNEIPVRVLSNAVNIYPPGRLGRRDDGMVNLLYVGKVSKEKGVLDLISSIRFLPLEIRANINVNIVGAVSNELREYCEDLSKSYGFFKVFFSGELTGKKKWDQFANSDIFVMPSQSEDYPLVILEAMGSGLPVVATDVGCVVEIVREGITGFIVPPSNPQALAYKISSLASNYELRRFFSENSREEFQRRFNFRVYMVALRRVYEDVL